MVSSGKLLFKQRISDIKIQGINFPINDSLESEGKNDTNTQNNGTFQKHFQDRNITNTVNSHHRRSRSGKGFFQAQRPYNGNNQNNIASPLSPLTPNQQIFEQNEGTIRTSKSYVSLETLKSSHRSNLPFHTRKPSINTISNSPSTDTNSNMAMEEMENVHPIQERPHSHYDISPINSMQSERRKTTNEVYGFIGWLTSSVMCILFFAWCFVPSRTLEMMGMTYYPKKIWAPIIGCVVPMAFFFFLTGSVIYHLAGQPPMDDISVFTDQYANPLKKLSKIKRQSQIMRDMTIKTSTNLLANIKIK